MIELVTIGTELLLGTTVDTNGAWLGSRLAAAGLRVARRATVPDDAAAIRETVLAALQRSGTVICTGGLGPTADDLTRPVVAAVYGRELVLDEGWLEHMRDRFRARGLDMPAINRVQAMLPAGARLLPNSRGTAPGILIEDATLGATILLPGVPSEMRALMDEHVVPWLVERAGNPPPIVSRTLRTSGVAESTLQERLADLLGRGDAGSAVPGAAATVEAGPTLLRGLPLDLAFLPTGVGIDLRLTCWGELESSAATRALDDGEQVLREHIGQWVYGVDGDDLAAVLGRSLRHRGLTLAVAESCTGGLVGKRVTDIEGASAYFRGGFVTYADGLKQEWLGVRAATLVRDGAVSEAAALEMATGAARAAGADCAIAVTGIAGPGGGSEEKPVGTVWIGVAHGTRVFARLHRFSGTREEIRTRAAQAAMLMLFRELERTDEGRGPHATR